MQQKAREEVAQVVGAAGEISHEHFEQLGSVKDVSDTNRIANNYKLIIVITLNCWYRTRYDEQTLGYNRSCFCILGQLPLTSMLKLLGYNGSSR